MKKLLLFLCFVCFSCSFCVANEVKNLSSDEALKILKAGNLRFQTMKEKHPDQTKERRKELVKDVKKKGENAKVAVRNIRRDAMDAIKKKGKEDGISEDEIKEYQDDVQKSTDKYVAKIDAAVEEKSKEILTV